MKFSACILFLNEINSLFCTENASIWCSRGKVPPSEAETQETLLLCVWWGTKDKAVARLWRVLWCISNWQGQCRIIWDESESLIWKAVVISMHGWFSYLDLTPQNYFPFKWTTLQNVSYSSDAQEGVFLLPNFLIHSFCICRLKLWISSRVQAESHLRYWNIVCCNLKYIYFHMSMVNMLNELLLDVVQEYKDILESDTPHILLDVREPVELEICCLPNAYSILLPW